MRLHRFTRLTIAVLTVAFAVAGPSVTAASVESTSRADDVAGNAANRFHADVPRFVEEARAAGIAHRYDGPWEHFVGGGVVSFDCDGDRLPDLYMAGGASPAALYRNRSTAGGRLRFERLPSPATDLEHVIGAYPLDLDDDGHQDLVVLRVGENRILKGGPDCRFTNANARFGFEGGRAWTTAFAATWEPGATHPTLAFGHYVDRSAPGSPWGTCQDNDLLRPVAGPQRYAEVTPLSPGHCALSMLFTDWDRSGRDALRITNDRQYHRGGEEQLWAFDRGRYPRLHGRAEGWASVVIWGMGIAEGDLDADGFPEYALTSMGDTRLQSLDLVQALEEGRPAYEDIAWARGATAHRPYTGGDLRPSTGWHAEFADLNNDARLDLYIAKGNVERMPEFAAFDPDNLLLSRADGRFVERGGEAGIALERRGRGAAVADLNADGLIDLAVVNRGEPMSLFRNTGPGPTWDGQRPAPGNWLAIELRQAPPNRDAIGARISVQTGNLVQTRRVYRGGGHASGRAGFEHLGLGVAERASIRVQWPDGEWSAPFRVFANQHVVIDREATAVRYWHPATRAP